MGFALKALPVVQFGKGMRITIMSLASEIVLGIQTAIPRSSG